MVIKYKQFKKVLKKYLVNALRSCRYFDCMIPEVLIYYINNDVISTQPKNKEGVAC